MTIDGHTQAQIVVSGPANRRNAWAAGLWHGWAGSGITDSLPGSADGLAVPFPRRLGLVGGWKLRKERASAWVSGWAVRLAEWTG